MATRLLTHGARFGWPSTVGLVARVVWTIECWQERRRQRRALAALSDTMLKDIGVERSEALIESSKPFWRS